MIRFYIFIISIFVSTLSTSQCINADSLYTNTITHENAIANWRPAPSPHHYLLHYRVLGTSNWSNLANIDSTMTSRLIPLLQPLTTYEWQIKTFCDSTNQPNSGWSYSDTFTTTSFNPSPFNPIITPIIGNTLCGANTPFTIIASQNQDEPDISSSIFFSDKGQFEISNLSSGDTVGNASYTSSFLNFSSVLIVDFTLGPNYAKIDLIDSTGSTMGFFLIENLSDGIKVTTIGPNDGNNYTNGYISQLNFYSLFVNPNEEGAITFTADINSELGDVIYNVDSSIFITCPPSNTIDPNKSKKLLRIVDYLYRNQSKKYNSVQFYIFDDGSVEKIINVKY